MTVETVNSAEARSRLRDLLDKVMNGSSDVVIERNGKPVAVLISVEDYQDLQEELEDRRAARRAASALAEWRRDPSTGRPYAELRTELVDEGLLDE